MIEHKYDADAEAVITEIDSIEEIEVSGSISTATLETDYGASKHKKFLLVDVTNFDKPYVIIQNLTASEKQEACEVLEKMLFGETYTELEDNSIRVSKPILTDFDHVEVNQDHLSQYDHIEY